MVLGLFCRLAAQTILTKADNATALDLAAAWSPAQLPAAADTLLWNGTYASGSASSSIGAGRSVNLLQITGPTRAMTIAAGTGALRLGASGGTGVDMSAAAQNFTINAPVVLGASQIWTINSARTLNVGGAVSDEGAARSLTVSGFGTAVFSGANTFTGGLNIDPPAGGLTVYKFGGNNPSAIATLSGGAMPAPITAQGRLNINGPLSSLGPISGSGAIGYIANSSTTANTLTFTGGSSFSMFQVGADNARATLRQSGTGGVTFSFFGYNTATPNAQHTFDGGTWTLGQIGQNNSGAQTSGTYTLTNAADVTISAQGTFAHGTWRVINGALRFNSAIGVQHGSATGTNTSLVLQVDNSGGGPGLLTATGGLTLADGGSMTNANALTVGAGGTVLLNGNVTLGSTTARTAETDTITLQDGELSFSGTLSAAAATAGQTRTFNWTGGQLTAATLTPSPGFATPASGGVTPTGLLQTGGTLAPGDLGTPGRTTINGNYSLGADGTLALDLGGPSAATAFQQVGAYDQLVVNNGSVTLAGTLSVTLVNGFVPTATQTFTLINTTGTGGGISGAFANVASGRRLATADGKGSFVVTVNSTSVGLRDFLWTAPEPTVTSHPASIALSAGRTASFSVSALGRGPLSYVWRKDGVAIPGATASVLRLPNVSAASAGSYDVIVSNTDGSATSTAATLTLVPASAGFLRFDFNQAPVAGADAVPDVSGANPGTLVGTPLPAVTTGPNTANGSAWDFISKSAYIRVPADKPLIKTLGNPNLSTGITFSFWLNYVYALGQGQEFSRLFQFSNGVETYNGFLNNDTFNSFGIPDKRNNIAWGGLDGTWGHFVFTYDFQKTTNNLIFYFNNKVWRTLTVVPPDPTKTYTPGDFFIGAQGPSGNYWPGKIDQFIVLNRAITAGEVGQLYTGGTLTNQSPNVILSVDNTYRTWPDKVARVYVTATDDALPTATRNLTRTWSKVSGPGTVTFAASTAVASPSALTDTTTATFSAAGTYVIRCTLSDSSLSSFAEETVEVLNNAAPVVTASADRTLLPATAPATIYLAGYVRDDGLPNPPGGLATTWSQVSGPATATFARTDLLETSVVIPATPGDYVLRLTCTDGGLATNADVTVTVAANLPPVVTASASAQTLPWSQRTATLTGVITDDGIPGTPTGQWSQLSGPGTVVFANAAALQTTASFPALGQYWLRFTGSDGQKSASADLYFTVWAPGAPFVHPGSSRTTWLPNATLQLSGSYSGNSTPTPSLAWSVLQTPSGVAANTVSFSAPNSLQTNVTFTAAGTYVLGLSVLDGPVTNTGRLVVQVYDSTATTANFGGYSVPSGNFGYNSTQFAQVRPAYEADLGLQFDLAGLDWNVVKPPPPAGVHPRIVVSPEDLPDLRARHGIGQPPTTTIGPIMLAAIRKQILAEITGPGARWGDSYRQLSNGEDTLYRAMTSEDANNLWGILAYEAWRCLLEQDGVAGAKVATAIATANAVDYATMQATPNGDWQGNFSLDLHLHFAAYAYDYAHAFMTPAQRAAVSQCLVLGVTNQVMIGMDALPGWAANCSNWIANNALYLMATASAVEGEPGFPADILPRLAALYDRFYTIGFGQDGAMCEGMGKGQINSESLVMLAKRGYNSPLSTAPRYCVQRQYLHSLETTGYAFTWDEYNPSNGGKNNNAASRYADVPVLKALYPQDPLIDFVQRNEYGRADYLNSSRLSTIPNYFIYSRADVLTRSALARDFRTDLTWDQAIAQQVAPVAPAAIHFNSKGLVAARSGWTAQDLRLLFLPRANGGGHALADRGAIALSALGRIWLPVSGIDPAYGDSSLTASVPRIDNVGPSTVPVRTVEFRDTPDFFVTAADLADAYKYDLADSTAAGAIPNFITPNSRVLSPRPLGWADLPMSLIVDWLTSGFPTTRDDYLSPHTPVQRAYRTLALARGPRPYVVVADDIQKDTTARAYLSRLMLEADLTSLTVNGNDAILTKPGSATSLLIRVVNSAASPTFSLAAPFSLNALDIAVTAVAPDFRVLLFPFTNGDALPVTSYQNNVLSVTLDGRTDRILFAPHADGRARLAFTRPSDLTPPVLNGVADVAVTPNTANPLLTFPITATDNADPSVSVVLTRASDGLVFSPATGATFAAGTTTIVTATATDSSLNTASATFTVTVGPYTAPAPSAPWTLGQVGATTGGSASHDAFARIMTITGVGADLWTGTSENYTTVSRPWTGNGVFTARVASVTGGTDGGAKFGIIFRETLAVGAKNSVIYLQRSGAATFQNKIATNGSATTSSTAGVGVPEWLRLVRNGNDFTAFYSPDGVTWTQQGTAVTHSMTGTALTVGLAVAPRTAGQIPTVVFDNISFLALPAAPAGLSASAGGPVVNLAWSPVADAATYAVKRASTPGGSYTIIAAAVAAPSYADASAPLDATAYYVVTASNLVGEGPVSAEVSAIPRTPLQLWRLAAFGTTAATGPAADLADPDGDGLPNLLEYAFGTSPTSAASVTSPVVSLSAAPNAKLQITFLRARSDLTYAVEASSDLAPGSWTVLATNPGSVSPTVSVTVTDTIAPTPRRFLRLRVTAP